MIYNLLKDAALRVMRAPTAPPDPPAGSHGHTRVYRASPRYLTYRLLGFTIVMAFAWFASLVFLLFATLSGELLLVVLAVVVLVALTVIQFCVYFAIRIDYEMRYYVVTDRSVRVRQGAINVREMTISFANVQNMRAVQGPLLRYFGIKHLQLDTAGGGGASHQQHAGPNLHRVSMDGIDNADEVRADIQRHLRTQATTAGLGDPDDHVASRPVATGPALVEALRELKDATAALRSAL